MSKPLRLDQLEQKRPYSLLEMNRTRGSKSDKDWELALDHANRRGVRYVKVVSFDFSWGDALEIAFKLTIAFGVISFVLFILWLMFGSFLMALL